MEERVISLIPLHVGWFVHGAVECVKPSAGHVTFPSQKGKKLVPEPVTGYVLLLMHGEMCHKSKVVKCVEAQHKGGKIYSTDRTGSSCFPFHLTKNGSRGPRS